eukprot:CAMPEP_0182869120 /NCGR_PEP_ID=MMETSP0034_2-20130328/9735_1 /TAXON_ID=156128 /ORGANISM="Nephroselmis pyriformis, Strain CCMP717" /LENGTH=207 /DNA_ID=CAMNT_0025001559 /DNA_START=57 /DNA_END=677 /DNA_ORIENTATION=-
MARVLNTIVFMGSARNITPPWGGDSRLGDRVLKHVLNILKTRESTLGKETVTHEVTLLDPVELFEAGGAMEGDGQLGIPHFFMKAGTKPAWDDIAAKIKAADAYVVVSPEYNHSIPPALSSLMGHFGGSNYACKPSAIVTYSAGPWGGMRAAMALRPMLSELGCLPVSKLTAFPLVGDIFGEDGVPKDPAHRMLKQLPNMLVELEWM